eukprot:CAMPEP_0171829918 /NCGR_PEP_ID=MMETSP0992-20121227/7956_1 /TAXON_ID=483369 /ORGANISM="non described non described, Strain CCMP2098" /LENGTH=670 /DNA_ID=CAMNT_0012445207 /DNA_START=26 /DNA_END=2038 /DNA_ORIENTATION=-
MMRTLVLLGVHCYMCESFAPTTLRFPRSSPLVKPLRRSRRTSVTGRQASADGVAEDDRASMAKSEIFQPAAYYESTLCVEDEEDEEDEICELPGDDDFVVAILGDLHMDPRKMEDYHVGRSHIRPILDDSSQRGVGTVVVSLGDLGESKSVRPDETDELFAGTTGCHELAADFLGSFGVPYEVVGGNHDLEGIDEFKTDSANLEAYLRIHGKPTAQFARVVADKVLLVGLGSTVFREARYTSHEVIVDDEQIRWFEELLVSHPAEDGWKLFVFSHAPILGSGLRVLQENHVVNGCCWLNHSGGKTTAKFIELVRKHRCVKGWFSGHFHLGQDYEDSITFPSIPREQGPYPNRGSCVFATTCVMRKGSSRDGRQQSRLLRGNSNGFEICTVDHGAGGAIRLDATITYKDSGHEVGIFAHEHDELKQDTSFLKVYSPVDGDANQLTTDPLSGDLDASRGKAVSKQTIAWWRMNCGRVLGIFDSRLIEYDPSTLAPLGLVVGADELEGKRVMVLASGEDRNCRVLADETDGDGGDDALAVVDCAVVDEGDEQALLLIGSGKDTEDKREQGQAEGDEDEDDDAAQPSIVVVHPNEDGSYWRKIVRNKIVRMKEKRRVQAAVSYAKALDEHVPPIGPESETETEPVKVISSWGPYKSISGTAKNTGVAGLTKSTK